MSAATGNNEKRQGTGWFRGVLTAILDVAPLPDWAKQRTASALRRLPHWYVDRWARALSIDYLAGYKPYPDLAERADTDIGRDIINCYLEAHGVPTAITSLRRLVSSVMKLWRTGKLPLPEEVIEHQVCALAWSACTPDGMEFAHKARTILGRDEPGNHVLDDYRIALERSETDRLQRLDNALIAAPFGKWVKERLEEAKRWLGVDTLRVRIQYGQRTPLWELLWQDLFTGGAHDRPNQ